MNPRRAHLANPALYRVVYDHDIWAGQIWPLDRGTPRLVWALNHVRPEDDVLDVGCHKGEMTILMRLKTTGRVVGVDISPNCIRQAMLYFGPRNVPIGWMVADAAGLPIPDSSFDLVVLSEILEHVPDPAAVVREAERVARNGGRIVVSVPKDAEAMEATGRAAAERRGALPFDLHVREYVPAVELAGKHELELSEAGHPLPEIGIWRLACYTIRKEPSHASICA